MISVKVDMPSGFMRTYSLEDAFRVIYLAHNADRNEINEP